MNGTTKHIHLLSSMFCFCKNGYLLGRCLFGLVWTYSALGRCIQLLVAGKVKNSPKKHTVLAMSYWNFQLCFTFHPAIYFHLPKTCLFTKQKPFSLFIIPFPNFRVLILILILTLNCDVNRPEFMRRVALEKRAQVQNDLKASIGHEIVEF